MILKGRFEFIVWEDSNLILLSLELEATSNSLYNISFIDGIFIRYMGDNSISEIVIIEQLSPFLYQIVAALLKVVSTILCFIFFSLSTCVTTM